MKTTKMCLPRMTISIFRKPCRGVRNKNAKWKIEVFSIWFWAEGECFKQGQWNFNAQTWNSNKLF